MEAKLTLKLNKRVIEQSKRYAALHHKSLSKLIETYLQSVVKDSSNDFEISPFVRSISTGVETPTDIDYKKEYRKHLNEKYK